jgi:hypothetical protein
VLDYDFHPPDDLRVFTFEQQSVLRFDETVCVVEADYGGTLLRHYAFPDRWFKINVTTDRAGNFVEEQADPRPIPFCFNCDIAAPMVADGNAVFAVDLWVDLLVPSRRPDVLCRRRGRDCRAMANGWLSEREVDGARVGLTELIDIIERKQLIGFLSRLQPFGSTHAPPANAMRRESASRFPLVHPYLRPSW